MCIWMKVFVDVPIINSAVLFADKYNIIRGSSNVVEWGGERERGREKRGFGERLLLRASYRCIYRTLRQLIKFSPKPSQTKNNIYMCAFVCFTKASILLQRWKPLSHSLFSAQNSGKKNCMKWEPFWHLNSSSLWTFSVACQNLHTTTFWG
jgi:hypothetical protein